MAKPDRDQLTSKTDLNGLPTQIRWPPRSAKTDADKLHTAILMGKSGRVRDIIRGGLSPDTRNRDGQTPLFVAAFLGKKDIVTELIQLGASPNGRCYPDGYTAVHGSCYIGSVDILSILLTADGDLRLTDTKRQQPIDWIEFQPNLDKRKAIRDFIEGMRYYVMKGDLSHLEGELHARYPGSAGRNVMVSVRKWLNIACCNSTNNLSCPKNCEVLASGFGKVYFDRGIKCVDAIGLPSLNSITDLKLDENHKAPSWINGKFTTFIPMVWTQRNTSVVVKTLRKKSVEEAVPDMLIAELDVLVRLQHPHILMLLAVCQEENFDSLSLVFEKISWGSLYFFLHQQGFRMKSTVATDIIIQISEALEYIHGSGFLHCAISSHAIMLVSENHAKLTCFEHAIPEDKTDADIYQSSRHPWLQTDAYISVIRHWTAPEILIKTRGNWQGSDVYSLCCVMWELVVGEVPWKDHNLDSLRAMMTDSPGNRLPLVKDIIPSLWLSVLQIGLKSKWEERDLDLKELRYMMNVTKDKPGVINGTTGSSGDRRTGSLSRVSLRSVRSANIRSETPTLPKFLSSKESDVVDTIFIKGKSIHLETSESETQNLSHSQSFKSEAYLDLKNQ